MAAPKNESISYQELQCKVYTSLKITEVKKRAKIDPQLHVQIQNPLVTDLNNISEKEHVNHSALFIRNKPKMETRRQRHK